MQPEQLQHKGSPYIIRLIRPTNDAERSCIDRGLRYRNIVDPSELLDHVAQLSLELNHSGLPNFWSHYGVPGLFPPSTQTDVQEVPMFRASGPQDRQPVLDRVTNVYRVWGFRLTNGPLLRYPSAQFLLEFCQL